jgi:ABC-2 type transport system ATP-binding protein
MKAVSVNKLSKVYGKPPFTAVDAVSFEVSFGSIFGLIGPDGAGKTSIFRMLTTLLLPDAGEASVNGLDVVKHYKDIRKQVGYMPGKFSLYTDLTIEENLHFFATVFGTTVEKNYHLIKDIYEQLAPFKDRKAGKLSGGMKQKLALCCALIHEPKVLFLDEPTTGVDPVSRKEFWEMLKRLKQRGLAILVSTPYMDEAALCDEIALIQNGKILDKQAPQQLIQSFGRHLFAVKAPHMRSLLLGLNQLEIVNDAYAFGEHAHVVLKQSDGTLDSLSLAMTQHQITYESLAQVEPSIEDCFIKYLRNGR